jgi:DNA-binding NarL/FixJ family response regulator
LAIISLLCVDDHPLFREGIATVVSQQADMGVVGLAATGAAAIQGFRQRAPDVTLMDLRLPDMSGIAAMRAILKHSPLARVIVLTNFEGDVEIRQALDAGARAYMLKSAPADKLLECIRNVHSGHIHLHHDVEAALELHRGAEALSQREIEVLRHVAGGNRNRDIAYLLGISQETVKVHIKHVMGKLGARDRTQSVAIAVRRGIIQV